MALTATFAAGFIQLTGCGLIVSYSFFSQCLAFRRIVWHAASGSQRTRLYMPPH